MAEFTKEWYNAEDQAYLVSLVEQILDLEGDIVEVGCHEGRSTIALANAVYPEKVIAVDSWYYQFVVFNNGFDQLHNNDEGIHIDSHGVYDRFLKNIETDTKGNVIPIPRLVQEYIWGPTKFLHIDADGLYDTTAQCIAEAKANLVEGGILCGHDYPLPGVRKAVEDVLGEHEVSPNGLIWSWKNNKSSSVENKPEFTSNWYSDELLSVLSDTARSVSELDGVFIEVGSWEGRSTIAIANSITPNELLAIDTWKGSEPDGYTVESDSVYDRFLRNTKGLNVSALRMSWDSYDWSLNPIAFLHIDAEHTYEAVRGNLEAALPHMVSGGVICGDDYLYVPFGYSPPMHPVKKAVDEILGDVEVFGDKFWRFYL